MMSATSVKERILIVDDQPDNIWPLAKHLKATFKVQFSTTGEEALEVAFSQKRPDLILLDIMMPEMDGYQVFEKLKADERTREIPVIFLTGKTSELEQIKGLDLGAQDYITKPFSLPVVAARVKSVLNLKREMDRRLLLRAQLEDLNQQLERQVRIKQFELEAARKALNQYENRYSTLFKKGADQQKARRLLVVDDNPDNIHILVKNLKSQYKVTCATSGNQALEIAFSDQPPDLILLDIMMPDMDGFEVCSRLKANTETWDIPVIFVTALDQEVDETRGLNIGAVDFVTKPFSVPVVKARIDAALRLKEEMEHRITLAGKLEELNKNLEERIREKAVALEQAHEDLRVSEKKYRSIFENATEGVFQITLEGRLLDANPALAAILGYESPKELVATVTDSAHQLYVRPQDRIEFINALKQKGEIADFETQFKKKNGDIIWVINSAKTIRDENNKLLYFQGFTIDITARKNAEEELRKHRDHLEELVKERTNELEDANSELEIANKELEARAVELAAAKEQAESASTAKSDFLARMSHEIRTPLNAVTGLTNIVLKSNLTGEQRDYLNKVQLAGHNLLQVINDILDFSKVEAGQLDLEQHPFELGQHMEQLADLFSDLAAQKDLELIFTLNPDIPSHLIGDSARLNQVLTNLIQNAVKFTETGEIVVAVEPVEPVIGDQVIGDRLAEEMTLKFAVSDTGVGIAADVLPTLFDPFTQAEGYLSRKHEGTGLGLAISQRLVELMGGRIWAESTPGRGSTFSFTVMMATGKEAKHTLVLPADLHGLKTLVVDDSATARQMLVDLLESFTFNVSAVESGEKAVEEMRRVVADEPYQLVLLDWKMPSMDGLETARRIRELEHQEPKMPIIIMVTAYDHELMQERIDPSVVDFSLIKPVKPSQLFDTIMEVLGQKEVAAIRSTQGPTAPLVPQLTGQRVLLVEDSELNRDVAVALLEEAGLVVEVAENGRVAVEKVTESPQKHYSAILMDIQMPMMDGYEATRRIRQWEIQNPEATNQKPEIRVPIIALTAHALKGEKEKCLAANMDDYLAKPLDEQALHRMLLKWIAPHYDR